ncbi:MAG: hypothetical protein H7122_08720 [Chitinophagaceae bacterium]|nr:hypothetical protein [Chitinophagaceae bacterium]
MKKFQFLLLLLPFAGMSQTKNVVSAFRVFPKIDKSAEFEKAFMAHAQKYHTGDWMWRVFEIQSGPDVGGFQVNEGPLTWEQFDKRGNLGAAHTADWAKNVMPFTADRGTSIYAEFVEELSTVKLTDYSDKIVISHIYPKPGMIVNVEEMTKKLKAVWTAGNESVAVYRSAVSGEPQYIAVTRLKEGLKELGASFRKPLPERYAAINGANSWTDYLKDYAIAVEKRWSELLFYRADMSSK